MIKIISVIYTDKKLSDTELKNRKQYNFKSDYAQLEVGDLIKSPAYTTKMQVVDISYSFPSDLNYPLKSIEITSINDKDVNKVIENGNNSNIELIAPTYKIESKKLSFRVEVSNLERAKEIQNNLEYTSAFVDIILEYGKIETKDVISKEYRINNNGLLEEIKFNYSRTKYDEWDGRAPLTSHWDKKYTIEMLKDSIIPEIKDLLKDAIKELNSAASRATNSLSYKIIKKIKLYDEINKLKDVLNFLNEHNL